MAKKKKELLDQRVETLKRIEKDCLEFSPQKDPRLAGHDQYSRIGMVMRADLPQTESETQRAADCPICSICEKEIYDYKSEIKCS
mmetsp:Transcript_42293/g.64853  ORF Transcript_42293/g.64853 Transcript_42293/m.64853 type:complete len:85 (+) Transcript_42293:621-875(+)